MFDDMNLSDKEKQIVKDLFGIEKATDQVFGKTEQEMNFMIDCVVEISRLRKHHDLTQDQSLSSLKSVVLLLELGKRLSGGV